MADTNVFNRLKKLFSTSAVVRNAGGKKLRVVDTDNIQSFVNRRGIDRYHRMYSSMTGGYGSAHGRGEQAAAFQGSRLQLFRDYDMMQNDPIISSVMDIYADESTVKDEFGQILSIRSKNAQVKDILHNLFYDILNVEFNLWMWVHNMCKYGDFFLYMDIDETYGVVNVVPLSIYETIRIEGEDPANPFAVKFKIENDFLNLGKKEFDNYEIAHFRLLADTNFLPYGKCLDKTAYVETANGAQTIDTLQVGQEVWVWSGTEFVLSPIKHTIYSGVKEVIEIRTPRRSIRASASHPILVWSEENKQGVYKTVGQLLIGDLLVVSANKHLQFDSPMINKDLGDAFNKNGWKNKIELIPDTFTEDFARLFGFLIGDGWVSPSGTISFAQGTSGELNSTYVRLLELFSGATARYTKATYTDQHIPAQASVGSRMLTTVLTNNGFTGTSLTKRVPAWVFQAPREIQLAFINGLVDADGSIFVDEWNCTRYSIELANEMLIRDIQQLLVRLNIKVGKVCSRTRDNVIIKDVVVKNIQPAYYIYFYLDGEPTEQVTKYDKQMGEWVLTEPVTTSTLIGERDTYDIQVESEHSNFIANGIIVHNSVVEGGRRTWKQLQLMEDAMLIHRIMRAPDKRKFLIDVGNLPPAEIDAHMQRLMDKTKKSPLVDPRTGDYNLRYNMMNITEDFYLPVRGKDSGTDIVNLPGLNFNGIEDIEYLRNKLMAAFKVPKSFLGYEEDNTGKCLRGNTNISLLDGREVEIREIAEWFESGAVTPEELEVYSYDAETNSIVPGKIVACQKTRLDAQLVRIHLDNGTYIDTTPDHGFIRTGGDRVEAQNLVAGDSLQAGYRRRKIMRAKLEYEQIYQPNTSAWVWTHKMVDAYYNAALIENGYDENGVFGRKNLIVIHHTDFNRFNNSSVNLNRLRFYDHIQLHSENALTGIHSIEGKEKSRVSRRTDTHRELLSSNRKKWMEANPESKRTLRDSWMARTHEDRVAIIRSGLTAERSEKLSSIAKESKNYLKAMVAYKEKYSDGRYDMMGSLNPRWRTRPSLDSIVEFIATSHDKESLNRLVDLSKELGLHATIVREVIEENGYSVTEFLNENIGFRAGRSKATKAPVVMNHKVVSVEWLNEREDTYNMEVSDKNQNHNFLVSNGIFIKNSSLAAQDVRFARTIERVQRIIVSELTKMAIIHLYVQGFRDSELVDFELEMTSPSVVYEQEKINLWTQKIQLANNIAMSKFLSRDWIYNNILELSEDDAEVEKNKLAEDAENMGKLAALEQQSAMPPMPPGAEGGQMPPEQAGVPGAPDPNAPAPEGEPAGEEQQIDDVDTILSALTQQQTQEPEEELEEAKVGRPKEAIRYGTDRHPRGRDPLGNRLNANVLKGTMRPLRQEKYKSPLALEHAKHSHLIKELNNIPQVNKSKSLASSILAEDIITDMDDKATD